jgi:hypothetical protein
MIHTAQDVVDYLLTATGGGAQDGEHRAVRQAVIHGVREVLHSRNWLWHTKTNQFTVSQISTTATAVTNTSNQITVASSTGIVAGRLLNMTPGYFDGNPRVTGVIGNAVTLDRPAIKTKGGGDTVTVLVQTYYDLPADLKDIDALVTDTVGTLHCYISPQEWQRLEVSTAGSGDPFYYTIMRSDVNPEQYQIRFVGVPTNNTVFNYTYRYQPKMVKYMGYEPVCRQGLVTPAAGSPQTVASSGTPATLFQSDMVGAMLRVGTATFEAEPIGALRAYVAQSQITAVTSATSITVEGGLPTTAGVKYAISDIIDCSPQMYTAILSGAELWYARLAGKPGADIVALFNRDLRFAMERDVISPLSGQPRPAMYYPTPRSAGWYSSQLPDQGSSST